MIIICYCDVNEGIACDFKYNECNLEVNRIKKTKIKSHKKEAEHLANTRINRLKAYDYKE